ncbi:MAG TPA: bifunctional 3'-5' exonuclease/DNA polymerase [Candidatus Lumbricidophila sp.]|nr:bifunctional 3'-5' exonuclease/DNA polymerase [Candidatus Lumbricidophila sp.]
MRIAVGQGHGGDVELVDANDPDATPERLHREALGAAILANPDARWVWADTADWYPALLAAGVRVERCVDLRLVGAILAPRESAAVAPAWLQAPRSAPEREHSLTLFDADSADFSTGTASSVPSPPTAVAVAAEDRRQRAIMQRSDALGLTLLAAAESTGALIAAEMHAAGMPWSASEHQRMLADVLGDRPGPGRKPTRMESLAAEIRALLGAPTLNIDSQVDLLRALRTAGIAVDSTAKWELRDHRHPAIAPLLMYKKLSRLYSANGWAWVDEWVHNGRFRPEYVVSGAATGRWATSGGGALQLPKQVRTALVADPGWSLVIADAAQLEPRMLAGLSGDRALADAARGTDLYQAFVDAGVVAKRDEAKVALLGAMYGATTGDSARLLPRLRRAYPTALGFVDVAAATGERGGLVETRLGRRSPVPSARWFDIRAAGAAVEATPDQERRARRAAADWGRFTRNFVVQGTAAEWALTWMALLRQRLELLVDPDVTAETASGPCFVGRPHLVFFLHDEVIVHTPTAQAAAVVDALRACASDAAKLLFGSFPIDVPLNIEVVRRYGELVSESDAPADDVR